MTRNRLLCLRSSVLLCLAGLTLGGPFASAQAPVPPPPKEYEVQLRYRIQAGRNERLVQFFDLLRFLKSVGFKKSDGPENEAEDPTRTRMTGTIEAGKARELLRDYRIKALLLTPPGYKLPENAEQPVKVHLDLAVVLADRQRLLADQVRDRLRELGFREAVGYDHRRHTRLVGTIPAGEVDTLLKDLRWQPTGWLAPLDGVATLPNPFRSVSPVLITTIVPEPEGVPPIKEVAAPEVPKGQEFLSEDLRKLLTQEGEAGKPRRLEVILTQTPSMDNRAWREELLRAAPGLVIEGRLGQLVTVVAPPAQAPALAALPGVSAVRLPRSGAPQFQPAAGGKDGTKAALEASGLARLHMLNHRGRGVRLAIIDGDFRGWPEMVAKKQLPAETRYLDLTAAGNPDLLPEPFPGDPKGLGVGTQYALAAAVAAPAAELLLIRVDPEAPYQLQLVARALNGDAIRFEGLDRRRDELTIEDQRLRKLRADVLRERQEILNLFGEDEETLKKKAAYAEKEADYHKQERAYQARMDRYFRLLRELQGLRGVRTVASSLVWNEGHPVDGSSPLSRYLDDNPFRAAFWFQAAGNTRDQVWAGPFRDADGNGVMEFAAPRARLKPGRWSPELNFLGWQPFKGKPTGELPEKATVRLTLQWREAHDPAYVQLPEDPYRLPLANLRILLLRQRDPTGTRLPADEMEVAAYSVGPPLRIQNLPNSATYEQTLEYTVDPAGHYAVRIEGRVPPSTRPPGTTAVGSGPQRTWELRARLFVSVRDDASRAVGRPVFLDYPTAEGGLGMPGDAAKVITIGAADATGRPQPYSASGPAFNLELEPKPEALAYDGLQVVPASGEREPLDAVQGTPMAASFAAGMTAAAIGAGMPRVHLTRFLEVRPGGLLRVPEGWASGR
jgi:hypothetical protein